uniref:hypothetical protein n=1 Tax=Salmonella sp. s54836 TaxID=3159673 RepID=UPI00397F9FDB
VKPHYSITMGFQLKLFVGLVVVILLITTTSADGPKFADDFTITFDTIEQVSSEGGQTMYNISQDVYSDTRTEKLRSDALIHVLNNGKTIIVFQYLLIDVPVKKSWSIVNIEGQPPGKCIESPYDGPVQHPLDFSGSGLIHQGVFPGPNGLMFDTWDSKPVVDNGTTLDFITLTSLDGMPATITGYQDTTFISTIFKDYNPTAPDASKFNLPPGCKNNTTLLKKEYKREYPEPFKYLFAGMHNFFAI